MPIPRVTKELEQAPQSATGSSGPPTGEVGSVTQWTPGLAGWSSYVGDDLERAPELQWPQSVLTYAQMRNDAQVQGLYLGTTLPLRRYHWQIDPNECDPTVVAKLASDLNLPVKGDEVLQKKRNKDRFSFKQHLQDALLALLFGHYGFEQVGEVRTDDLLWHLQKLAPRPPETISEINVDRSGELQNVKQYTQIEPIGVNRLVWYAWQKEGANWPGRSMLRACYRNWLRKDRLLRVDATKQERNGMGIPIAEAPAGLSATAHMWLDRMMRRMRGGDMSGGAVPSGTNVKLVGTTGTLPDTIASIRLDNEEMARAWLAMFMQLGQTETGSRALGSEFIDFFSDAVDEMAQWFCDGFTAQLIEDWWDWNVDPDADATPILTYARNPDSAFVGRDIATLVHYGALTLDEDLENAIRQRVGLPERMPGTNPPKLPAPPGSFPWPPPPGYIPQGTTDENAPVGTEEPSVAASARSSREQPKNGRPVQAAVSSLASPSARSSNHNNPNEANHLLTSKVNMTGKRILATANNDLVTVANVPMVSTGIDYPTSTGVFTITEQHIADAIASQDDPAVHPPRTKIGHTDPRFNASEMDGEPSLGTWMNLRTGDNGQTIYGDLVGVPRWLGDIVATAFPSRSIEGNFDVETVTGKKWSLVIDQVALLGVIGPGITTLDDLPLMFSSEYMADKVRVIESQPGEPMSVRHEDAQPVAAKKIVAQANLDDVRQQYYNSLGPAQMWWWIRAMYVDPGELIVDDDEGGLYRVPFSTDDDGNVTFEEPQPVVIQYVDKPQAVASKQLRAALSKALGGKRVAATFDVRAESRPTGGKSMDKGMLELLRSRTGLTPDQLPDDADDATIMQALGATDQGAETGTEVAEQETSTDDQRNESTTTAPSNTTPQVPEGMRLIDEATLSQLQEGAEAGLALMSVRRQQERDECINAAIKAGKIMPSRRGHFELMWSGKDGKGGDPEGTKQLLESLAEGIVPISARGSAGGTSQQATAYDPNWLAPSERQRVAASAGANDRVIQGGD